MLNDQTNGKLDEIFETAAKMGERELMNLQNQILYLSGYACHGEDWKTRCDLYTDFAPLSFSFCMFVREAPEDEFKFWFNGGLIFHGNHDGWGDGGAPTFSVSLCGLKDSEQGMAGKWQVHT